MTTIRNILAATDFSARSLDAVDRGFDIADRTGARYSVMHALELDAFAQLRELLGARSAIVAEKVVDDARVALQTILADAARNRGVSAGLHLEEGRATIAVQNYADAVNADLVVLGSHGEGFLQGLLLGSTASRLVRKSRTPVLVVKNPCQKNYRRVLVAVDLSPASLTALRLARQIAPDAEINLLHVYEVPFEAMLHYASVDAETIEQYRREALEQAMQRMHMLAKAAQLPVDCYTLQALKGNAARIILQQEIAQDCDLIAIGKHGTHEMEELLLGSVTKHVLEEARADVLVVTDRRMPDTTAASTTSVSSSATRPKTTG